YWWLRGGRRAGGALCRLDSPARSARLFGEFGGSRFADHGHLDLTRVLELVLDLARDLVREQDRRVVIHLRRLDHDADLASGLESVHAFHSLLRRGDLLERLEALDVALQTLPAGTRP